MHILTLPACRRLCSLFFVLCSLLSACAPAAPQALAPAPSSTARSEAPRLPSAHTPDAAFRRFYEQQGGRDIFGAPLTAALAIDGVTTQYFEHVRLELHEGTVVPGELGAEELRRQAGVPEPAAPREGCRWFEETGHNLCGALGELWQRGEKVFGPPLAEAETSTSLPGRPGDHAGTLRQVFRNAILEQAPGRPAAISPLGDAALARVPAHAVLRSPAHLAANEQAELSSVIASAQPLDEITALLETDANGTATVFWGDSAGGLWPQTVQLEDGRAGLHTVARGALGAQGAAIMIGGRIAGVDTAVYQLEAELAIRTGLPRFDELLPRVKAFMEQDISEYRFGAYRVRGYRSPDNPLLWLRDHVHQGKGYIYWEQDMTSLLDLLRRYQHSDGSFDDYLGRYEFGVVRGRKETEADLEYLFVEGVYRAWQATGDDVWMRQQLEAMEHGLRYATSHPWRWDEQRRLVKRPYTIDTWDFEVGEPTISPDGNVSPRHWIDGDTRWAIFHGDNTGYASAMELLARMYEHLGDATRAAHWRGEAAGIRDRLNALAWNGRFYRHMVPFEPLELPVDQAAQLSLSNAYALNRGVLDQTQAEGVLDEYQARRRPPDQSFAEWYSIDPPFPAGSVSIPECCSGHRPGEYVNGGIMPLVGGELAQGAFAHGYETYGFDILQRYHSLIAGTGASYLWYYPIGQPGISGPDTLPTDGWGASAMLAGLIQGAAGVQDRGSGFSSTLLAPRWAVVPEVRTATVVVRYGASPYYVAYRWQREDAGLRLSWTGSGRPDGPTGGVELRILLPAEAESPVALLDGNPLQLSVETVRSSRYVVLNVPASGELELSW